jgi:N-acetyl-1-D-myo-inositol-2-amino-2-deoxy-alpha-D-glucopyranoside deacetylase
VAALRAHATQVEVWEGGGTLVWALTNGVAQPLLDTEEFTVVDEHAGVLDDLFTGIPT